MDGPHVVVWDITHACPLRCEHCYSEAGRRPARRLDRGDLLRVADTIIEMGPALVDLCGGEPLVVPEIFEVAERLRGAGVLVALYTGGWPLRAETVPRLAESCDRVVVSVDGATAEVHDRLRGRAGSFDRAMRALELLDEAGDIRFAVDCAVMRSNFDQLASYCTNIAPRFPNLRRIGFEAATPFGLASRAGFAARELVTEEQWARLAGDDLRAELQALAPRSVLVETTDNRCVMMHPDDEIGPGARAMFVEADGDVRAMTFYEGSVGNLRLEPWEVLWQRSIARWRDPVVTQTLAPVRTMRQWADAVRALDRHFASAEALTRIDNRPMYPLLVY
jgi:MoaA/NifB/PqqE/SkfB family radical SAM enzyme